jgi:hypothetical protein
MNELEITAWSLYLEQLEWNTNSLPAETFLLIIAMQAKDFLNDEPEMEIYLKKVNEEYTDFKDAYDEWVSKRENNISLEIKDINKQYNKYRLVRLIVYYSLAFDNEL